MRLRIVKMLAWSLVSCSIVFGVSGCAPELGATSVQETKVSTETETETAENAEAEAEVEAEAEAKAKTDAENDTAAKAGADAKEQADVDSEQAAAADAEAEKAEKEAREKQSATKKAKRDKTKKAKPQAKPASNSAAVIKAKTLKKLEITETTFLYAIDGDTIETSAGRVRIIGIDTPERNQCGYETATRVITDVLAPGDAVRLGLPAGQNDRDRYDRLLRYVITESTEDIGMLQLLSGNAVARYDSRDGYPKHPLQKKYRNTSLARLTPDRNVLTTECAELQGISIGEEAAGGSAGGSNSAGGDAAGGDAGEWWFNYSSCTKLKKNTVGHPKGPFDVNDPAQRPIYDWFAYGTGNNGDGDHDGLACE